MTSPNLNLRRLATLALCAITSIGSAQTLARPGWAGSGLNGDPWWKRAVVYEVDPKGFSPEGLRGITQRLGYIQDLNADTILLDNITSGNIDPAVGTADDLDDLIHQASSRSIRVLLNLDPKAADLTSVARLWLTHGVAGFRVPGATSDQLANLKKVINSFVGQRILLGDLDPANPQPDRSPDAPQLLADPRAATVPKLTADAVRPGLEAAQDLMQSGRSIPALFSDGPTLTRSFTRYGDGTHDIAAAKALAAILLANRTASLLYYGQELGLAASTEGTTPSIHWDAPPKVKPAPGQPPPPPPPAITPGGANAALEDADPASLLNWYRQLSALHHSNRTIGTGTQIVLNHDDQNVLVWIRKPQTVSYQSPPVVVVCNLSPQPVTLSLKEDIQKLHFRGSFLRPLLRSDNGMGAMHLESMTLSPYMVYIGELLY
jgi:glycosidase